MAYVIGTQRRNQAFGGLQEGLHRTGNDPEAMSAGKLFDIIAAACRDPHPGVADGWARVSTILGVVPWTWPAVLDRTDDVGHTTDASRASQ